MAESSNTRSPLAGETEVRSRTLVVTAHPDDVDYGAAGAVARWVAEGEDVRYCVVTDGDSGHSDLALPKAEVAAVRRTEQQAAARAVGVRHVDFLGLPDGRLTPSPALRRCLTRVLRTHRPHRVVTHSPVRQIDRIRASHPDHLAVGEALFSAVYPDARNPRAFPELAAGGLDPWRVAEIWVMTGRDSNTYVDITATLDAKCAALRCHASQHTDPEALDADVRRWAATIARAGRLPEGRYAESFRVVSAD
ncbi:PIG-L deacetylase family protein [Micromonospora sp. MH99]|uniref:PIG-L deacetylase family protein n=1 Tax=Micromonospora sp. MH99 TaxID=1945510 RepID=UPI001F28550B|nr:PIG-L deacetylase family protein [Micromonospora sp. MH99]MCF0091237.1 N-acetyl-alpha-D-glucosaminyl L-malate deacetylase 1 [Micromonospora sp. MH99]